MAVYTYASHLKQTKLVKRRQLAAAVLFQDTTKARKKWEDLMEQEADNGSVIKM